MFKNLIIFLLVLVCALQSYILYSNKDQGWLDQSIKETKNNFQEIIKPTAPENKSNTKTSTPVVIENAEVIEATQPTTTTESFAFKHLETNVDCSATINQIEKSICEDADLNDQDKRLNFILNKWTNSNKTSEYPIATQPDWLNVRSKTCSNLVQASLKICIQEITEKRIQAITGQI